MCTGCHSPHASNSKKLLKTDQPELCYNCHDKAKFTKKYVHGIIAKGGCTACHTPHISNYSALLNNNPTEGCVTCHLPQAKGQHVTAAIIGGGGSKRKFHPVSGVTDPRFPGTKKKIPDPNKPGHEIEVYDPEHPGKLMTCTSCHDPHSSDYRHLFPAANVCQLCHQYF
jgi:predicted CXXCH cytochrome family protein